MMRLDNLRVLVADDHRIAASIVSEVLRAAGIRHVRAVEDGGVAFQVIREAPPDLALIDLAMPGDGLTLLRHIRRSKLSPDPSLPVIAMSGYTDRRRIEALRDAGADEIISKPLSAGVLLSRVAAIIERPRQFIACDAYVGPDRRRLRKANYEGPLRRRDDNCGWDALEIA